VIETEGRRSGSLMLGSFLVIALVSTGTMPLSVQLSSSPQKQLGFERQRSPAAEAETSSHPYPLHIVWQRTLPRETLYAFAQAERAKPLWLHGRLYVGSSRAKGLFVLEPRSGAVLERFETRGGIEVPISLIPQSEDLLFGDTTGLYYRMTLDGETVWEHEANGPATSAVGIGGEKVFYHAVEGALVALDLETGEPLWSFRREHRFDSELPIFGASKPLVVGDLVLSGFADGSVAALRISSGELVWERRVVVSGPWTDVDGDPILIDGDRIIISAFDGSTVCLKVETGDELWRSSIGGGTGMILGSRLFVPTANNALVAISLTDGAELWRWSAPKDATLTAPTSWKKNLFVLDSRGDGTLLDPSTGKRLWRFHSDPKIAGFSGSATVAGDLLIVLSDGGIVYALAGPDYVPEPVHTLRGTWLLPWE